MYRAIQVLAVCLSSRRNLCINKKVVEEVRPRHLTVFGEEH
jgi:hypothetical protein